MQILKNSSIEEFYCGVPLYGSRLDINLECGKFELDWQMKSYFCLQLFWILICLIYFITSVLYTLRFFYGEYPVTEYYSILWLMLAQLVVNFFALASGGGFYYYFQKQVSHAPLLEITSFFSNTSLFCFITLLIFLTLNMIELFSYQDAVILSALEFLIDALFYAFVILINFYFPTRELKNSNSLSSSTKSKSRLPSLFITYQYFIISAHVNLSFVVFFINLYQAIASDEFVHFYVLVIESFLLLQIFFLAHSRLQKLRSLKVDINVLRLFQHPNPSDLRQALDNEIARLNWGAPTTPRQAGPEVAGNKRGGVCGEHIDLLKAFQGEL